MRKSRKSFIILMSIMLLAGAFMLPAATKAETVSVTTWAGLCRALSEPGISNGTVKLAGNVTSDENAFAQIEIPAGQTITLDLAGYTIDRGLGNASAQTEGYVIANAGTLTITDSVGGGAITGGNNAGNGGGIYNTGTLTISGGTVTDNCVTGNGGGIYNTGTLILSGGAISNNTATLSGGGIVNQDGAEFTMTGGIISGNKAVGYHGGGVYNAGTFNLQGGSITSNNARGEEGSGQGGGILQNGTMNVSGDPAVRDNTALSGYNIYLRAAHPTMTVTGQLTSGASLYVTSASGTSAITKGYSTANTAHPGQFFTADRTDYGIARADGEAKIQADIRAMEYTKRSWNGSAVTAKTETAYEVRNVPTGGNMDSGWYYLNRNATINDRISISGDTHLILGEGYTLDVRGLYIPYGKTLYVYGRNGDTGKIYSHPSSGAGIGAYKDHLGGNLVVYGGTIEASGADHCAGIGGDDRDHNSIGSFTMYGGTVTATGGNDGAGIGGGRAGEGGTITIYGGKVTATGGHYGAGIGGGNAEGSTPLYGGKGGKITIWGGTVTATGGDDGAGIGGGEGGPAGKITIHGGKVTARGGNNSAGIGCGEGEDTGTGGTVTIDGGTVTATGGGDGAGIGGGENGYCETITISDGTVTATGGTRGAGIGGGNNSDSGTIVISGGNVTATGQNDAAGIGGGDSDNADNGNATVTITGGNVTATAQGSGASIGASDYGKATVRIEGGSVRTSNTGNGRNFGGGVKGTVGDESTITLSYSDGTKDGFCLYGAYFKGKVTLEKNYFYKAKDQNMIAPGQVQDIGSISNCDIKVWDGQLNAWGFLQGYIVYSEEKELNIQLQQSLKANGSNIGIRIPSDKTVTIDLNGCTLDRGINNGSYDYFNWNINNVFINNGTLTIKDSKGGGKITGGMTVGYDTEYGNDKHGVGGGIWNVQGATLYLQGGAITRNRVMGNHFGTGGKSGKGGGVYNAGTMVMSGGSITNNTAANGTHKEDLGLGGGIFNASTGTLTITGGQISGNGAEEAGSGIYNQGTLKLYGGKIINNKSITTNHYVYQVGTVNTQALYGGIAQFGTMYVHGSPVVNSNTGNVAGNIWLPAGKVISVDGALASGAQLDVVLKNDTGVFTSGYGSHNPDAAPSAFFTSPDKAVITQNGEAAVVLFEDALLPISVTVAEGTGTAEASAEQAQPGTVITLSILPGEGEYIREVLLNGEVLYPDANGGYSFIMPMADANVTVRFALLETASAWTLLQQQIYQAGNNAEIILGQDTTAGTNDKPLYFPAAKTLTLNLNGKRLDRGLGSSGRKADGYVIRNDGTLTVRDSAGGGMITGGNKSGDTGGILNNGTLTIAGGTISGNKATGSAGAIMNSSGSTLTVSGGAITGNTVDNYHGGAIYNAGTLNLTGGSITNNSAGGQGGGILQNGIMNVSGSPVVSGNTAGTGNNIYLRSAHPVMNVTGAFETGAALWVSAQRGVGSITDGYSDYHEEAPDHFFEPDPEGYVITMELGEAKLTTGSAFTVTFDSNGGTQIRRQRVAPGATATEPEEPTKENHTFTGWFLMTDGTPAEEPYDFSTPVNANITLKAGWEQNFVIVAFDSAGGSGVETQTIPQGGTAEEPEDPTRDGYAFTGWFRILAAEGEEILSDTAFDFSAAITEDTLLKAGWSEQIPVYTVSFSAGEEQADGTMQNAALETGSEYILPDCGYTVTGKAFVEWSVQIGDAEAVRMAPGETIVVTADTTATALWAARYTVAFAKDDETAGGSMPSVPVVPDSEYTLPECGFTCEGKTFMKWSVTIGDDILNRMPGDDITVTADATVTAIWGYTVSFDSGTGSGEMDPVLIQAGTAYRLPASDFTAEGKTRFREWSVRIGTDEPVSKATDEEITVSADTVVTAVYEDIPTVSYTVTLKVVHGSWDDEGHTRDDIVWTVTGYEDEELYLTYEQIPRVGRSPDEGYGKMNGRWDTEPSIIYHTDEGEDLRLGPPITANEVHTYIYEPLEPSFVKTAPQAVEGLVFNGQEQELVTAGETDDGDMDYALGDENGPTETFWITIPTGTDAGTYYVWYRVFGDLDHMNTEPEVVIVTILPAYGTPDFILPAALMTIGESAFEGLTNMTVVDAHNCTSIDAYAFRGTGLTQIMLPADCAIDDHAFDGCGTVYVYAPGGGSTEAFCTGETNGCVLVKTN